MATQLDHNIEYPEELQLLLEELLGSRYVYFQPPDNQKLVYPCIVYRLDYVRSQYANNNPYRNGKRYLVTYIDKIPDQFIPDKLMQLPTASFDRAYISDNLHHTAYHIYYDAKPNN